MDRKPPARITLHPLARNGPNPLFSGIPPDADMLERLSESIRVLRERAADLEARALRELKAKPSGGSSPPVVTTGRRTAAVLRRLERLLARARPRAAVPRSPAEQSAMLIAATGLTPEQVPAMVRAIKDTLGSTWTSELEADWTSLLDVAALNVPPRSPSRG